MKKNGIKLFRGRIKSNLYTVKNTDSIGANNNFAYYIKDSKPTLKEIHERYGHTSIQRINKLNPDSISKAERDNFECKACVLAKITKQLFDLGSRPTSKVFQLLHLNLIGPITPKAKIKSKYILTVVDNFSGYLASFPLVTKDETTESICWKERKKQLGYLPDLI
jgi:hypothetical protein